MAKKLDHKKIKSYKMSKFVFVPHILIFIASLFYFFTAKPNFITIIFILVANIVFFAPQFLYFKTYKFTVTNRKIYIKNDFLRINQSLDLVKNLCYLKYNQGLVGLILNYGNFEFIDENNKVYKIDKLPNPKQIELIIVEQTNKYLAELGIEDKIGSNKEEVMYESLTENSSDKEVLEEVEATELEENIEIKKEKLDEK